MGDEVSLGNRGS